MEPDTIIVLMDDADYEELIRDLNSWRRVHETGMGWKPGYVPERLSRLRSIRLALASLA